ncbi:unnamed protein product [Chironomus riparius]|uniref:Cytochrome P450 n=1 Tax=Chironomus riparius TaxID=315576 RepID=A0A9P0J126_9DIPT|nr:unnamed protein product [Chironomus riparius]
MYPLIDDAAKQFTGYINMKMASNTSIVFDVRDISLRYSCNSITSTTYAFNAKAYDGENTSEILNYGRKMWKSISSSTQLPSSPITREVNQYFIRITNQAVQRRRYNNEKRNDLLNYVISLKDKRNFSEIETAAHAMTFFLDGFETSSLALCYVLYELSKNTRVQEKLRIEINENIDKNQTVPIETLLNLTYLDQVFYEAIRLHPPLYYTTRQCNESIELISDEQKILIPNGTTIWIPIYSIHRDPDIYENPHEFMPERFNEENGGVKAFRDKCVLIPFGESAHICLGKKLGTLQIKAAVVELLRNFELICDDSVTDDDLEIRPQRFANIPKGEIKVQFKKLSEF